MEMKEEDRRRSWDIFGIENENDSWQVYAVVYN